MICSSLYTPCVLGCLFSYQWSLITYKKKKKGSFGRHRNSYTWSIIPHYLRWCLWKERNSRCFEDIERSILDLKLFFFRTLLDWLFALQKQSFPSFIDFLDSCNFSIWFIVPLYTPYVLGGSFFVSIKLITYQKKIISWLLFS